MPATMEASSHQGKEVHFLSNQQFDRKGMTNQLLITVFQHCILNIKEHLSGTYLFLLTDEEGALLAMDYSPNLKSTMDRSPIHIGMFFTEQSCGVNAISEAIAQGCPVYLTPEQHESPFFKNWHCYSTPLNVGLKNIGYLDVSTVNADMKSELIAIAKLIPADMLAAYQAQLATQAAEQFPVQLSERQLKVLKLISQGLTGKAIAAKLKIKECTVNHHKKIIFNKLGVQSSTEAVSVATRLSFL
ncbi:DNA-binding CsgD family transcriptional regulator [Paenibacillus forsythiae]|uniref:DNA-binding CsgD family transcriptional regulator n=1 Tax=Paenibacillus forsythiae TaxID=365616 RepID=A0ABU3H6P0_9BACL|nr:LuxR C-terminal-related transcriptional regulator [Paenibacillus forsythiae]MDT3426395.1 DNA-binding CsgD family transcriptional regulator [Paenibacillus forsythiae]